jgi:hypothetical protein
MKDIVVGFITGYDFDKIKPWVNSLDRSGFTGTKAMICYNISYDVAEELTKRDYTIFAFKKNDEQKRLEYRENFSIMTERFFHLWHFLHQHKGQYRNIITTDVKDVVFQTNPSIWLEQNLGDKEINVACESMYYKDEAWGDNNLLKSFGPVIHAANRENLIFNAGTISGKFDTMVDLFLNIFMVCQGTNPHIEGGGGPDQAALNILLNMKSYKDITNFAMSEDGWAAQLGTTGPQIQGKYGDKVVEKTPILVDNMVCTSKGTPFALVHQYDRVPEWKQLIEKKYA